MQVMQWDDTLNTTAQDGTFRTGVDRTVEEVHDRIRDRPESLKYNVYEADVDLTALGALFVALVTLPAGAVVKAASALIKTTVVAGSTSVKVGIGPTGTKNKYGTLSALTADTHCEAVFASAVGTSSEAVLLNIVATNGTSAGDTTPTAGLVKVRIEYETMNVLLAN